MKRPLFIKPLLGDWLVVSLALVLVCVLFKTLWQPAHAATVQIRQGDVVYGTYSLNQARVIQIHGPLGDSTISIAHGQVRFVSSPCRNHYCVHQGWLSRAGQVAICLPNRVSITLLGADKLYDSLNY